MSVLERLKKHLENMRYAAKRGDWDDYDREYRAVLKEFEPDPAMQGPGKAYTLGDLCKRP